jgi:hypothetical protein
MVARGGDHDPGVGAVVTNELDPLQAEEARDFVDNRREDTVRCRPGGDERRDPSERRLLVAVAADLVVRLCVCDRGRNQVRECRQPFLGAGGKWLRPFRGDEHDAPEATLDDDRRGDRRAPAVPPGDLRGLTRGVVVPVDTGRPSRFGHDREDVVAADR